MSRIRMKRLTLLCAAAAAAVTLATCRSTKTSVAAAAAAAQRSVRRFTGESVSWTASEQFSCLAGGPPSHFATDQ